MVARERIGGGVMLTVEQSHEWQAAAHWQAQRGLTGQIGDPLPNLLSGAVLREINEHPEDWQVEVRRAAYALARERSE